MRRRTRHPGVERGSSTVEFVIAAVVMVLLLMVVVQFALWFHTRAVATTAARHGLDRARILEGSPSEGEAMTRKFLDQNAGGLHDRAVTATRNATHASVTVQGRVVSVIPGLHLPVTVRITAPVERIVP